MLEDLSIPNKPVSCRIRTVYESLTEPNKSIFIQAIENPEWPMTTLANELKKRGIDVSDNSIRRHRKRTCSC
jgi:hypothetical protein